MQSACGHICQCSHSAQSKFHLQSSQAQSAFPLNHTTGAGEWIWSTNAAFAAPSTSCLFSPISTSKRSTASSQATTTFGIDLAQPVPTDLGNKHLDEALIDTWMPQDQSMGDLWNAAASLDTDDSLFAVGLNLDLQTTSSAVAGCGNAFPISPQESLSTPGLVHSPSNAFTFESTGRSKGLVVAAQAPSSVSSNCSVPATPTSLPLAEMSPLMQQAATDSASQANKQDRQGEWDGSVFDGRPSVQGLASAFDFTGFPGVQNATASTPSPQASTPRAFAACGGCNLGYPHCACSAPLKRSSTSMGTLPVPTRIATPAPGWLNPDLISQTLPVEAPTGSNGQQLQAPSASDAWSFLASGTNAWASTTTMTNGSRYEPYRSPSIASTASNSSQNIFAASSALPCHRSPFADGSTGGRRRSSTVGSLPGPSSSLVDRVRVMSVTRPQSPIVQQQSLPSSPRSASRLSFNSMPCRGSRPSEPALRSVFLRDAGEATSIKERRMASWNSRSRAGTTLRSPLAGLFGSQDEIVAQDSPTISELSQGSNTPTSSSFATPPTLFQANVSGDVLDVTTEGNNRVQAKIAVHHHRTKLQRNVLNEVVTSLQGAYKHCRRQYSADVNGDSVEPYSLVVSQLGQLDMHEPQDPLAFETWMAENDPCSPSNSSSVVIPGETKEMRKNRQKAESKMRMRRKEVVQFAALTTYAKLAYDHGDAGDSVEALVSRSLAQVFLEHGEDWGTLISLEKRLFHTVRLKLGLQELFVKKLAERLSELSPAV
ncbi:conserved hypothetical protein [Sporisorium reilianum SRZ2]|uniref:Uncharacterized protein n=1 Tax=Sporisorium reilianum (strain SRZ2) TaxID=999809 RepID=E6ZW29_SPORE|nr:conserved hypothetical protein [Sporisorium reilianum SRZ2]